MENLKQDVQQKFAEIRNALHMREKLLLRQADVILQQTKQQMGRGNTPTPVSTRQVNFLIEQEDELLSTIRNFGRFQLDNINLTLFQNEDYITPVKDHETMYKCLEQNNIIYPDTIELDTLSKEEEQPEAIIVDFSRNKSLIEHNAKHMNESIINITLQEAKELIKKAKLKRDTPIPPLNLEELDDELESSIAEVVSSLGHETSGNTNYTVASSTESKSNKATKKPTNRFKPKITINNCNGTINLRNISNLTINCATEETISAEIPVQQTHQEEEAESNSKDTSSCDKEMVSNSSTIQNKKGKTCRMKSTSNPMQKNGGTIMELTDSSIDNSSTSTTTASSSNYSSNSSSRSQSKKQKSISDKKSQSNSKITQERTTTSVAYPYGMVDYEDDCENMETHAVTCDFYNRLLKEIKNSLRTKRTINQSSLASKQYHGENEPNEHTNASENQICDPNSKTSSYISSEAPASEKTSAISQQNNGRRLVLKNFENLRIVLEANSSDEETFHPVQIEQWLAEIISETDLEPMQNTDILEHSKIHNENT